VSGNKRENETKSESARSGRNAGSGARGRQGATVERSPSRRRERIATGTASTERDHGRSKIKGDERVRRQGTG
jgi:hypothetical protein